MDPGGGGAFGGGKAGAAQDPLVFLKKPVVVVKLAALIFAIIVFGCISSQGWTYMGGKDVCIMNEQASACHFSTFVGVIGFVGAIALLVGEWFFEQMSSIKTRKHFVIADMAFSIGWAAFYAIAFLFMSVAWSKSSQDYNYGSANILGAIFFALCSVAAWCGSAFFAYQRFKAGADTAFSQGLGGEDDLGGEGGYGQTGGYGAAEDATGGDYGQQPFEGGGQAGMNYQQQVQY